MITGSIGDFEYANYAQAYIIFSLHMYLVFFSMQWEFVSDQSLVIHFAFRILQVLLVCEVFMIILQSYFFFRLQRLNCLAIPVEMSSVYNLIVSQKYV